MASALLFNSSTGKLVMNASGKLIFDTLASYQACCCGGCQVKPAILERQKAAGVSAVDYISLSGSYTLEELCEFASTFVDEMYPGGLMAWIAYADNSWNGGSSTPSVITPQEHYFSTDSGLSPTVLITTESQLCDEIIKFQRGFINVTQTVAGVLEGNRYIGGGTSSSSYAAAKTAAEADWAEAVPSTSLKRPEATYYGEHSSPTSWACTIQQVRARTVSTWGLGDAIARRARLWVRSASRDDSRNAYDKQGWSGLTEDVYTVYTDKTHAISASNEGVFPNGTSVLPNAPSEPVSGEYFTLGWVTDEEGGQTVTTVDWDFDY